MKRKLFLNSKWGVFSILLLLLPAAGCQKNNDLSKEKFIRVHKSYIINIDKVERFNSKFAEIGITKIPLSRNKKEDLVKALSFA